MAAGLPNITGNLNPSWEVAVGKITSGAFYSSASGGNNEVPGTPGGGNATWYFNASRSSSIYGASSMVTPLSRSVFFLIRF